MSKLDLIVIRVSLALIAVTIAAYQAFPSQQEYHIGICYRNIQTKQDYAVIDTTNGRCLVINVISMQKLAIDRDSIENPRYYKQVSCLIPEL